MNSVFENVDLSGIMLSNRIIRSATHEGLTDEDGRPTLALIKRYESLARGGVGAIITGFAGVTPSSKRPQADMLMLDEDNKIDSFKDMCFKIHKLNTPIILQLVHLGRQIHIENESQLSVAPSSIKDKLYNNIPTELSNSEISNIINSFVNSIIRAKKAGFDGVQLNMAHGYLLSSFLSPHMNMRNDMWGGSTEKRFALINEIFIRAKEQVGNYPILVKMNAFEKSKNGLNVDQAIIYAKMLEKIGCHGIEVSCGIAEDGFYSVRGDFPFDQMKIDNKQIMRIPKLLHGVIKPVLKGMFASPEPRYLYNLASAKLIKKEVNIPVIVVGGIRTLENIESIIQNKDSDFVSMSRPFILEPNIVNKFKSGKQRESKCIDCNYCLIGIEARPLKCYFGKVYKQKDIRKKKASRIPFPRKAAGDSFTL